MTSAQVLAREVGGLMGSLASRLGPGEAVSDQAREEYARAQRSMTALGAVLGLAPAPTEVRITAADVRGAIGSARKCPGCGEPLRLVPSSGFGPAVRQICGGCGHEPAA